MIWKSILRCALICVAAASSWETRRYNKPLRFCAQEIGEPPFGISNEIVCGLYNPNIFVAALFAFTFTISTACVYYSNKIEKHRGRFLFFGISGGAALGIGIETSLPSALLSTMPWAILVALVASEVCCRFSHDRCESPQRDSDINIRPTFGREKGPERIPSDSVIIS